jgi:hypothetical protein
MQFHSISLLAGKLEVLAAVYDNQEDRLVMSVGVLMAGLRIISTFGFVVRW